MSMTLFSPKQVANALGVSESSVKRWVDSGKLQAVKTAGGHRKVPLPSVATFVRESGMAIANPTILGMVEQVSTSSDPTASDLFEALVNSDEAACRHMVLSQYQRGITIADIGDNFIGPAFQLVGQGWKEGSVQVYQERRSCEIIQAILTELRGWLPIPKADAPLGLVATPSPDFAETGAKLVELTLLSVGWRAIDAGSSLPFTEIRDAVLRHQPRMLCLSVSHFDDVRSFVEQCNASLLRPLRESSSSPPNLVVGGNVLQDPATKALECHLAARSLADLAMHLNALASADE